MFCNRREADVFYLVLRVSSGDPNSAIPDTKYINRELREKGKREPDSPANLDTMTRCYLTRADFILLGL